ncbi:hypothetical protein ACHAWF_018191 [Thalassiosira exigua]
MDKNLLECTAKCIERMNRHVKVGSRVSKQFYCQDRDAWFIGGEVQGKGDVPPKYTLQSSVALKAHAKTSAGLKMDSCEGRMGKGDVPPKYTLQSSVALTSHAKTSAGLKMDSCNDKRQIAHHAIAYVDDTDDHTGDERWGNLEKQGQSWSKTMRLMGHSLAFHKMNWHLIAWELLKGELKLVQATESRIVMEDGKGGIAIIDFLGPDQPNVGLGYKMCPAGHKKHN